MRQELLVTIKIQQFLNSADQTDNPEYADLATTFAGMCRELNSRLEQCANDIQNDSSAKAIYLAESEPPIMEMASILGFEGREDWNELCMMYDWEEAPRIKQDLLALLRDAYKDHSALEPLLNEYRKKAKTASLKVKIHLLRRIKDLDSKTPQREEDLVRFENERLLELKKDARKAIEAKDETRIKNIYMEITSPEWLVIPPDNVVSKMARELAKYRVKRLQKKAADILHELANSYSNFEVVEVKMALGKWDLLIQEKEFKPEKAAENQVKEAREWFHTESAEMEKTTAFNKLQEQFSEDMEYKRNLEELDNKYHKLMEFGHPLPENLSQRYRNLKADKELDARRSHTFKLVICLLVIGAIIAGLGFFINLQIKGREYNNWVDPIVKASEKQNLEQLNAGLKNIEHLKEKEPDFYDAKVVQAESVINSRIQEINTRIKQFNENIQELNKINNDNFKEYDRAVDLVKHSEILLQKIGGDETQKTIFNRIKTSLKAYEIRTQDARDKQFSLNVSQSISLLRAVQAVDAEKNSGEFAKQLKVYEVAADKLLNAKGINEELKTAQIEIIKGNLTSLEKELNDALEANKERKKLKGLIQKNIVPLDSYKLLLSQFVDKFPADPEASSMQQVLTLMPAYQNAALLKNFNPETFVNTDIKKYQKIVKDHPASNIWRNDLGRFVLYQKMFLEGTVASKNELGNLKNLPMMKFKVLRFKNKKGDVSNFYTAGEIKRNFSQINEKRYCRIKTEVVLEEGKKGTEYTFQQEDAGWSVKAGHNTLDKKLTALAKLDKAVPVAGHVAFCTAVNLDIALMEPAEYQLYLINGIEKLKTNDEINPYIRLQFIEKLLGLAGKFTIDNKRIYKRHEENISKFLKAAGDLNWLTLSKAVQKKMIEQINNLPDLSRKAEKELIEYKILYYAVGRRIKEIGVYLDGKALVKGNVDSQEIWGLFKNDGVLSFILVGKLKNGKGEINSEIQTKLINGQPLFAPNDGKSTRELTRKLEKEAKRNTEWPDSWPGKNK